MPKQQQEEHRMREDPWAVFYQQTYTPEAKRNAQERLAAQQEARRAELLAQEQARQERDARRMANEQKNREFAAQAAARNEAWKRGEIAPAQAASIPTLAQCYQDLREQEVKQQAETRAAIAASPYAMPAYRLPPGSKFLKDSKEAIINGTGNES